MGKLDDAADQAALQGRASELRAVNAGLLRSWLADRRHDVLTKHKESAFVPGRGSVDPRAVFVVERPGRTDAVHRLPLTGRSGDLFDALLREVGWGRQDVYVTHLVKWATPSGRPTNMLERECGVAGLVDEMRVLRNPPLVLLGRQVEDTLLGRMRPGEVPEWWRHCAFTGSRAVTAEHPSYGVYRTEAIPAMHKRFADIKVMIDEVRHAA
jgi:DNA polymerase